jgi:hypothetical protein
VQNYSTYKFHLANEREWGERKGDVERVKILYKKCISRSADERRGFSFVR